MVLVASFAPAQAWACFAYPDAVECKIEYLGKEATSHSVPIDMNKVDTLEYAVESARTRARETACVVVCQNAETQKYSKECVEDCLVSATCHYVISNPCDGWLDGNKGMKDD